MWPRRTVLWVCSEAVERNESLSTLSLLIQKSDSTLTQPEPKLWEGPCHDLRAWLRIALRIALTYSEWACWDWRIKHYEIWVTCASFILIPDSLVIRSKAVWIIETACLDPASWIRNRRCIWSLKGWRRSEELTDWETVYQSEDFVSVEPTFWKWCEQRESWAFSAIWDVIQPTHQIVHAFWGWCET